jgi:hypothetical protein
MSTTYRVIMIGARPGHAPDHVARGIAELFKVDAEQAASMLSQRALTIKRGVDLETAAKYQASLEKRGCACLIEPDQQAPPPVPAAAAIGIATDEQPRRKKIRVVAGVGVVVLGLLVVFVLARMSGF